MGESRVASLSEQERRVLRALARRGKVSLVAREIGRSHNTIKGQLDRARKKLGVQTSHEAAELLAREEGHPFGVNPRWAVADEPDVSDPTGTTDGPQHILRDSAELRFDLSAVGPEPRDYMRGIREALKAGMTSAVTVAALIALIIFGLSRLPDAISNRTFEPEPAANGGTPE